MEVATKLCVIMLVSMSMSSSQAVATKAKSTWNHFVFAQQWPTSVCINRNLTHEFNCLIPDAVSTWTIHGLWPSQDASRGPDFCNSSAKFDPEQLASIQNDLQIHWPNLFTDAKPYEFWEHEWLKHGTCAMIQPDLDSELKYFKKGLEIGQTFELSSILSQYNITPDDGNLYQYADFLSALTKGLNQTPVLQCIYDKEIKTQFIIEVEFCISKTYQLMECPTDKALKFTSGASQEKPCRDTEPIAYPVIKH